MSFQIFTTVCLGNLDEKFVRGLVVVRLVFLYGVKRYW